MKAICTKLACFLLVLLVSGVAMAESITSPNGQLQLNFSVNAQRMHCRGLLTAGT